jgi:hypothetical protein
LDTEGAEKSQRAQSAIDLIIIKITSKRDAVDLIVVAAGNSFS